MILPDATLGMLGGGQLGRMFTLRARAMGYHVWVLDPDPLSPAGAVADRHIRGDYRDERALAELAAGVAVVTSEFENVPAQALERLAQSVPVRPGPRAFEVAQDRETEKTFFRSLGLGTAPFAPVASAGDLATAWRAIGGPAILKTNRLGYDGKGQASVATADDLVEAFRAFGVPCILEQRVPLTKELSVILARSLDGATRAFPVVENHHVAGILDRSVAPAPISAHQARVVIAAAERIAEALDYVGVLGVEFFLAETGELLVNEMAPRPHNTGHYTLDACVTDQFEQQLRAISGLPLGDATQLRPAAMANLLGDLWTDGRPPAWDKVLEDPRIRLHLYGKRIPRPGRKMGHLTCLAEAAGDAEACVLEARALLASALDTAVSRSS